VPKIVNIEVDLTKQLQKSNGAVFLDSQCICMYRLRVPNASRFIVELSWK